MYKIFDIHVHTYPEKIAEKACENLGHFYNFDVQCKGIYEDLKTQCVENNVSGFLTFAVVLNPKNVESINNTTAQTIAHAHEDGLNSVGFMSMHQDFEHFGSEVDRCEKMGLRGVKIHPDFQQVDIDSPKLLPLYEIIEGRMPIVFHMGDDRPEYRYSEPQKLANILDMFPKLEVIATHMGGYLAWEDAERYLYGRPNVWYDISSVLWAITPEHAAELVRKAGTERVLFGTDYPVMPLEDYIGLFMKLPLNEREREDIFYNNAQRLLGL